MLLVTFPRLDLPKKTTKTLVRDFDLIGFSIFAPACIMLLIALEWGGTRYAWNSATTIGLLCGAVVATILFVLWEIRAGDHAMIPVSVVSRRIVYSSCFTAAFQNGSLLLLGYYLQIWFQVAKHFSPTRGAISMLPTFISQVLFAVFSGVAGKNYSAVSFPSPANHAQ